jgi:hypothetical protein
MTDWIDFDRWPDCRQMERPSIVFEVQNADGLIMQTPCVIPLEVPSDWTSPPERFRIVEQEAPRHSEPIPLPKPR